MNGKVSGSVGASWITRSVTSSVTPMRRFMYQTLPTTTIGVNTELPQATSFVGIRSPLGVLQRTQVQDHRLHSLEVLERGALEPTGLVARTLRRETILL